MIGWIALFEAFDDLHTLIITLQARFRSASPMYLIQSRLMAHTTQIFHPQRGLR
jgi:hypothetical protein